MPSKVGNFVYVYVGWGAGGGGGWSKILFPEIQPKNPSVVSCLPFLVCSHSAQLLIGHQSLTFFFFFRAAPKAHGDSQTRG